MPVVIHSALARKRHLLSSHTGALISIIARFRVTPQPVSECVRSTPLYTPWACNIPALPGWPTKALPNWYFRSMQYKKNTKEKRKIKTMNRSMQSCFPNTSFLEWKTDILPCTQAIHQLGIHSCLREPTLLQVECTLLQVECTLLHHTHVKCTIHTNIHVSNI